MSVARDGLASLHGRMRVIRPGEPETGLGALLSAPARHELTAVQVTGGGTAERELAVPYRGERLSGDALLRQLDAWVAAGVIESSCADAVRTVAASPELARPARPHGRGARGGRRGRPAAGAAELGRAGDRVRPAPPGHLGPGAGDGAAQRRDPARPGR